MTLEKITIKEEYEGDFIGSQMMDGDMDIFFGIIGSDEVLLKVASDFAMEDFLLPKQCHPKKYSRTER